MASAAPTSTAPKRSRKSTERNAPRKTTASRLFVRCGLMSSHFSMLQPSSMMIAAIAGMGMTAIARAKKGTRRSSSTADMAIVTRLWMPSLCTSHMRLKEAEERERHGPRHDGDDVVHRFLAECRHGRGERADGGEVADLLDQRAAKAVLAVEVFGVERP